MSAQPIEPPDADLGAYIRTGLRRQHMTIDDLAAAVGVHRSTLSRWIAGPIRPSPQHMAALEQVLGPLDAAPEPAPAPQVVVIVASTPEAAEAAVRAALDRAGTPRTD
jgi:transcriptional regulator with XRE-family HTH domain